MKFIKTETKCQADPQQEETADTPTPSPTPSPSPSPKIIQLRPVEKEPIDKIVPFHSLVNDHLDANVASDEGDEYVSVKLTKTGAIDFLFKILMAPQELAEIVIAVRLRAALRRTPRL